MTSAPENASAPRGVGAAAPAGADFDRELRTLFIWVGTLAMFGFAAAAALQLLALGVYGLAGAVGLTVAAACLNLVRLRQGGSDLVAAQVCVGLLYTLLLVSNLSTGGFYDPNFSWFYTVPLLATLLVHLRAGVAWAGVVIATTLVFWQLAGLGIEVPQLIPEARRHGHALFNRLTGMSALVVLAAAFVASHRRTSRALVDRNREFRLEARCVRVLQQAATAANEADDFDAALRDCASRVIAATGWKVAMIWEPARDGSGEFVRRADFVGGDAEGLEELLAKSSAVRPRPGELALGRVIERAEPEWASRAELLADESPRAEAALRAGLGCALAIPVENRGEVLAVLEFWGSEEDEPDERLVGALRDVGRQVGRVAERLRLQETLRRSQKLESVGQLAAGIAHEINNPMAFVHANLGMLRTDLQTVSETAKTLSGGEALQTALLDCEQLISESLEGVDRVASIVRDVREFARDRQGPAEWADLEELIVSSLRIASTQRPDGIRVATSFAPGIRLLCRPSMVCQALLNLIVNAQHAMPDGGTLRISTQQLGDEAVVCIEDEGNGILPEHLERIFEPFFTTKPSGQGTGLGLYISHEILRAHDAEIGVDSTPGRGTRFTLRFPLRAE